MLDQLDATSRVEVQLELLRLMSSSSMWKSGQYTSRQSVARVLDIVRDPSCELLLRRAAVQVLLNWGEWEFLAHELPKLPDRLQLGPAVTDFIVKESRDPGLATSFRLTPNGAEHLVRLLPVLIDPRTDCVPALIALLQNPCPWREAVPAASDALGNLGPAASEALPALRTAARSSYSELATAAQQAITQVKSQSRQSEFTGQ